MTKNLNFEGNRHNSNLLEEILKDGQLHPYIRECSFNKGDVLWRLNDTCTDVPFILTGVAFVSVSTQKETEKCFSWVWANDLQGYLQNLFSSRWESQAIVASHSATICFVNRNQFVSKLKDDVVLQNLVIHSFSDYCRFISTNCVELSSLLLEERFTRFLAILGRRFGRVFSRSETEITIYLTRSQVASILRTRVETIIRILAQWRKKKWIRDTSHGIAVCGELNSRMRALIDDVHMRTGQKK